MAFELPPFDAFTHGLGKRLVHLLNPLLVDVDAAPNGANLVRFRERLRELAKEAQAVITPIRGMFDIAMSRVRAREAFLRPNRCAWQGSWLVRTRARVTACRESTDVAMVAVDVVKPHCNVDILFNDAGFWLVDSAALLRFRCTFRNLGTKED